MDGEQREPAVVRRRGRSRAEVDEPPAEAPLAVRMRPRSLDELVGQEHLLGEGSALRTAIERGEPHSAILYGPPGSGKTTLARIIATAAAEPSRRSRRSTRGGPRSGP